MSLTTKSSARNYVTNVCGVMPSMPLEDVKTLALRLARQYLHTCYLLLLIGYGRFSSFARVLVTLSCVSTSPIYKFAKLRNGIRMHRIITPESKGVCAVASD